MKNTKRSAFTIVELVIVIAVIAILSAVLIPTFGSIIESANKAVDTQLVAQINTVLAIEDVLGGGVNDAVEIQKVVKENGLKLQTKSKGQYIWYDIENKRVVLGGLDENGIVLDSEEPTAALDANGPVLLAAGEMASKGKFRAIVNNPESFVNGYLFISNESADGFAQAICALRNSDSVDAIQDALADIGKINGTVSVKLTNFMKTVAVITSTSSVISTGDTSTVKTAIVSSELTHVKSSAITKLAQYTGIQVVDFHSGVETFEDGVLAAIKNLSDIKFCYNSTGVGKIDKADETDTGIKNNLISPTERDELFKKLNLVYIDQNGVKFDEENNIDNITVSDDFITSFAFPYVIVDSSDINTVYDFVAYSFYSDGSNPIPFGTTNYKIEDYDKILSDEESGVLTIYAVYKKQAADFKIGNNYYGSGAVTYKLANNGVATGDTITVVSTKAKLDASLIGKESAELTIPSGVELLLPYADNFAKKAWTINQIANDTDTNGTTYNQRGAKYNASNYAKDAVYDKTTMTGRTNLTIAGNVKLNVASGAGIYVDAACYNYATYYQCYITNNCGVMVLEEGSEIISSGNITAYGIIRGEGTITTNGGTITELLTMYDWYGGTNASNAVKDHNVTPFNNWKIENILVEKVTINHPTQYRAKGGITVSIVGTVGIDDFVLAGPADSEPIFATESGSVIERSVSDDSGNMKFVIAEGKVADVAKELPITTSVIEAITVRFTEIGLPISHMDISVAPGAELTVSNNIYKIMPGSSITVETETDDQGNKVEGGENGILNIATKVVFYNSFDLKFEEKSSTEWAQTDLLGNAQAKYAFSLINAGAKIKVTKTSRSRDSWFSDWKTPTETSAEIAMVYPGYSYSGAPATKLVINGELNFENGATFAGNIISTVSGAKITVNANVSGHEIHEGYYIQHGTMGNRWYDVHDSVQHKVPLLAGAAFDDGFTSGKTYISNAGVVAGNPFCQWQEPQPPTPGQTQE